MTSRLPERHGAILQSSNPPLGRANAAAAADKGNIQYRFIRSLGRRNAGPMEPRGRSVSDLFSPPFSSLSFYSELGFYPSLQRQINSGCFFFFLQVFGGLCEVRGARSRARKKGRRSGGAERNEGVQGHSEGTGLLSQPADEELIRGVGGGFVATEGEGKKKKLSLDRHCANILFGLPSFILPSLLSQTVPGPFPSSAVSLHTRICSFQTGHRSFPVSLRLIYRPTTTTPTHHYRSVGLPTTSGLCFVFFLERFSWS